MSKQWQIPVIKSIKEILEETKEPLVKQVKTSEPQLESLKEYSVSGHGGKRPGAGFPKGKKKKKTLEKEEGNKEIRRRVFNNITKLIDSQMNIALGISFLYKVSNKKVNGKEIKLPPKLVNNQSDIEAYLNGDYEGSQDAYYFITTQRPDNKAIDSLLDRVFGKAKQSTDLKGSFTLEDVMNEHWEKRREAIEKMSNEEFINNSQNYTI